MRLDLPARLSLVYVHGETGRHLRPAPGQPTHNVVEIAREGLKLALREALRLAVDKGQATLNQALSVRTTGPTAIFTRSA